MDNATAAEQLRQAGYTVISVDPLVVEVGDLRDVQLARDLRAAIKDKIVVGARRVHPFAALAATLGLVAGNIRIPRAGFTNCPKCGNPYNPAKGDTCFKCYKRDNPHL